MKSKLPATGAAFVGDAMWTPARSDRSRASRYLLVWVILLVLLAAQFEVAELPRNLVATQALVVFAFGFFCLSRCTAAGFWSPVSLFLLLVAVFHISLVAHMLTGVDPELSRTADYAWYNGAEASAALEMSSLGMAAYMTTALLCVAVRSSAKNDPDSTESSLYPRFARVGAILLMFSVGAWLWIAVATVGLAGITGSYQSFLASTQVTDIHLTYPFIAVGLGLTAMAPIRGVSKIAVGLFCFFAVFGFFLGLRGEVLFPLAIAVSVLATRRRMPNFGLVALGGLVLLTLINAAKQIRQAGLGETEFTLADATPLAALSELGSTLRVVATVFSWHSSGGEQFRGGDTYSASLVRFIEQAFTSIRPAAASDFRLFNIEISTRAGNIGGSIIGEAYHNFDVVGVALVMGIAGVIFASFSVNNQSALALAIYVVIAVPIYNHIRNSFAPVLPTLVAGVLGVLIVYITRRFHLTGSSETRSA